MSDLWQVLGVSWAVARARILVSVMKLQKLVYYSRAWHLVWVEERLFPERIEAWANGPVAPAQYEAHRGRFSIAQWPLGDPDNLDKTQAGTMDAVIATYGHLDGRQLSYLTHEERPWRDARAGLGLTETSHVESLRTRCRTTTRASRAPRKQYRSTTSIGATG